MKKYRLKILTSGEGAVGKTTFLQRYTTGTFVQNLKMTIGVEFFSKDVKLHNKLCYLIIWDFGGQDQFRILLPSYVEGANGALFMFDLSHIVRSLRNVDDWMATLNKNGKIPIILIGTKSDLVEEKDIPLNKELISDLRKKHDFIDYIETSSKTGDNVPKAIEKLVAHIVKKETRKGKKSS